MTSYFVSSAISWSMHSAWGSRVGLSAAGSVCLAHHYKKRKKRRSRMMVQRRPHEDSVGFSRSVTYEYITNPTRPEPVSTMVITAPLFSKKVRKVCSTLFIPTGYTHSHTTSGPVRVVCAPRYEARGAARARITSTHTPRHVHPLPPSRARLTQSARRTRPPPARPPPTCARRAPCRTPPSPAAPASGASRAPPPS